MERGGGGAATCGVKSGCVFRVHPAKSPKHLQCLYPLPGPLQVFVFRQTTCQKIPSWSSANMGSASYRVSLWQQKLQKSFPITKVPVSFCFVSRLGDLSSLDPKTQKPLLQLHGPIAAIAPSSNCRKASPKGPCTHIVYTWALM